MNWIFDVDGTLTPSRRPMAKEFANWFEHFATHNAVYFVTGSDRSKTVEQIPTPIYNLAQRVYQCNGNSIYEQDRLIYETEWKVPDKVWKHLESWLNRSSWGSLTGKHFDERPGFCNFSVLGRNATPAQRKEYNKWDIDQHERVSIAYEINYYFSDKYNIEAVVAGETGIDIYPKGCDKSQILKDFDPQSILFFGDRTSKGGNDYPLAKALGAKKVYPVDNWRHTWQILRNLTSDSQL